jgi:hypothetical protein
MEDGSGRPYYYHPDRGNLTQWQPPPGWVEVRQAGGREVREGRQISCAHGSAPRALEEGADQNCEAIAWAKWRQAGAYEKWCVESEAIRADPTRAATVFEGLERQRQKLFESLRTAAAGRKPASGAQASSKDLRIWPCCKRKNGTVRTWSPICAPGDTPLQELPSFNNALQDYVLLFVEELHARSRPTEKIEDKDALIFFKRWDPHEHKLSYLGRMIFKPTTKVEQMVEAARAAFMPKWKMCDLVALEELRPDQIENLTYSVFDDNRQAYRDAILQDRQVELQSGDIIVFQPKDVAGTRECVKDHYDYLYHKVLVSFRSKAAPDKEAFELWLNSQSQYEHVCEKVAHEVNELKLAATPPADGDKLQLWRHSHKDGGPDRSPAERKPDWQLGDILINNHHGQDKNIVYYEELWYSVDDLKTKMLLRYKMGFGGKGGTNEVLVSRSPPEAVAGEEIGWKEMGGDHTRVERIILEGWMLEWITYIRGMV